MLLHICTLQTVLKSKHIIKN